MRGGGSGYRWLSTGVRMEPNYTLMIQNHSGQETETSVQEGLFTWNLDPRRPCWAGS
jgi:hypothetical protein